MDEVTLKAVRRTNIKTEKYDELADEFRRARLPLATDVMMGLPGSTVDSFRSDLQKCTDRDVRARCHPTRLLPNSPMNEPSYREEFGIVARPHEIVMQTKSYTRDDWDTMEQLRVMFSAFDGFGMLRHIARFVRSETGLKEVAFYERLGRDATEHPLRWPIIASVLRMMQANMGPPSSWGLFVAEVGEYVVTELGVERGSALECALRAQLVHLPEPTRNLPQRFQLEHDYVAWLDAALESRAEGHHDDWERFAPRLGSFPPGEIEIRDPNDICGTLVGKPIKQLLWNIVGWDMASPAARAK
jgi:hypothetical protein